MLPKEAIEEFKVLYKKEFSIDISDEEASRRANNLVNLYKVVYTPVVSKEAEQKVNNAFDVLFDEVERSLKNCEDSNTK